MRFLAHREVPAAFWLATVLLFLGASLASETVAADVIILVGARLVDPEDRNIEEASLMLEDGVVVDRGAFDAAKLRQRNPRAAIIDLDGSFLLPGLVDLRIHAGAQRSPGHVDDLGAEGTARLLLSAGITSYVDVHLDEEGSLWRERQRRDLPLAARSYRGSPVLTAPGGFGAEFPAARTIQTAAEVDSLLQGVAADGDDPSSDLLTLIFDGRRPYRRLDAALLRKILGEAERRSMPCVVAVGTWSDVEEALRAGATRLCHLPEGPIAGSALEEIRRRPPAWIPTVAVGLDFAELLGADSLRDDRLLRRVAPGELIEDYAQVRIPQARYGDLRRRRRETYANLVALDEAGVRWLAGSDAGSVATFLGWTLHRELYHWEQAGLDRWAILAAACVESARILGWTPGFEKGDRADYVVLPRDPSQDVTALSEMDHVILAGRWIDPAAVAAHVPREIRQEDPPNPIPFGGRGGLFAAAVLLFAVLLALRGAIKRAARSS